MVQAVFDGRGGGDGAQAFATVRGLGEETQIAHAVRNEVYGGPTGDDGGGSGLVEGDKAEVGKTLVGLLDVPLLDGVADVFGESEVGAGEQVCGDGFDGVTCGEGGAPVEGEFPTDEVVTENGNGLARGKDNGQVSAPAFGVAGQHEDGGVRGNHLTVKDGLIEGAVEGVVGWVSGEETPCAGGFIPNVGGQEGGLRVGGVVYEDFARVYACEDGGTHGLVLGEGVEEGTSEGELGGGELGEHGEVFPVAKFRKSLGHRFGEKLLGNRRMKDLESARRLPKFGGAANLKLFLSINALVAGHQTGFDQTAAEGGDVVVEIEEGDVDVALGVVAPWLEGFGDFFEEYLPFFELGGDFGHASVAHEGGEDFVSVGVFFHVGGEISLGEEGDFGEGFRQHVGGKGKGLVILILLGGQQSGGGQQGEVMGDGGRIEGEDQREFFPVTGLSLDQVEDQ